MNLIEWNRDIAPYSNGYIGKVGKYTFFTIYWDSGSSQDTSNKWRLGCYLPGIKNNLGSFPTPELTQERAEIVLSLWLESTNLRSKHGNLRRKQKSKGT